MPLSPFVKKCELVLHEKGLAFDYRQVSPLIDQQVYFEHNPLGKMPVLRNGDFALPDSSAIAAYLDALEPEPRLIPDDPEQRGWVLWLEEFSDSALLELCAGLFRCRFIGPRLMGLPVDEEGAQQLLAETMPRLFDYLEAQFDHGGEHLAASGYSLADVAVTGQLCMFKLAGEAIDPARWPRLAAWDARIEARPAMQACLAEEQRFFDIWQNSDTFKPADGNAAAQQLGMDGE